MKIISQGAEAKIYLTDSKIIKDRIKKDYRIQEIDEKLRTFRTKREAKILEKLHKFGFVPKVLECDDKEKLVIEYIEGPKLRDVLDAIYFKNKLSALEICREIGKKIKIMHDNHIIHGDLTTSNMMLNSNILLDSREKSDNQDNNQVYFIDFGLSFVSQKVEDNAKGERHKDVISRLEKVEARGRNKAKGS